MSAYTYNFRRKRVEEKMFKLPYFPLQKCYVPAKTFMVIAPAGYASGTCCLTIIGWASVFIHRGSYHNTLYAHIGRQCQRTL